MSIKQLRKTVFWLMVMLYFIVAPLLSLYALGFVFDPSTTSFVKTGIISIASEPKDARVSINGAFADKKTPTAISGLAPASYDVRLSLPGHRPWQKTLQVRSEEVVRAEKILLIPEALHPEIAAPLPALSFAPSRDGKTMFLLLRESDVTVLSAFDVKKKRMLQVAAYRNADDPLRAVELQESNTGQYLLIQFIGKHRTSVFVSTLSEGGAVIPISGTLGEAIGNIRFHPKDGGKLLYLEDGALGLFDFESGVKRLQALTGVASFEAVDNRIYYFNHDHEFFSSDLDGKHPENLLPDKGLRKILFGDGIAIRQMVMTGNETAFWLRQDGTLMMNRLPYFVDENVESMRLSTDPNQLLYWKSGEVWLLDLGLSEQKEGFFEAGPTKTLVMETKEEIVSAQLIHGGQYALITTNHQIGLTETALIGKDRQRWTILTHQAGRAASAYLDESSGRLIWIDRDEKGVLKFFQDNLFEPALFTFSFRFREPYQSPARLRAEER